MVEISSNDDLVEMSVAASWNLVLCLSLFTAAVSYLFEVWY